MKRKVAFVDIHNSCRSQIAEGWAKKLGSDIIEPYSAGIDVKEFYPKVRKHTLQIMEEEGLDTTDHKPKKLIEIPGEADIMITMGEDVCCPFIVNNYMECWGIDDLTDASEEEYRKANALIKEKVIDLIERIKNKEI